MKFVSVDKAGKETDRWTVFSIGGGALAEENDGASSVNYETTKDVFLESAYFHNLEYQTEAFHDSRTLRTYAGGYRIHERKFHS